MSAAKTLHVCCIYNTNMRQKKRTGNGITHAWENSDQRETKSLARVPLLTTEVLKLTSVKTY